MTTAQVPGSERPALCVQRPRLPAGVFVCIAAGVAFVILDRSVPWIPWPITALGSGVLLTRIGFIPLHGADFAATYLLHIGIVLLGLQLSLSQLRLVGEVAGLIIVPCVLFAAVATFWLGRLFGLGGRLAFLIAAGTAICGNSAIATVAPAIGAQDEDVAAGVAVITLFGTLALITLPLVAAGASLSSDAFGIWAGTAINDTSQVVASAYSISDRAGETATVVKLTRNLFIIPAALGAIWYGRIVSARGLQRIGSTIPWFIIALFGAVVVGSFIALPDSVRNTSSLLSKIFILSALTAIGIRSASVSIRRSLGIPLVVATIGGSLSAALSLFLVMIVS